MAAKGTRTDPGPLKGERGSRYRKRVLAAVVVVETLLMLSCGAHDAAPAGAAPPAASGSAAPAPPKRRESKEPSTKDPSIKPPIGYRRMALGGIAPTPAGNAVVLMDEQARRGLLLRTRGSDALSIALRVDRTRGERLPSRSSLADVVRKYGGDVVNVRVDRLEDDVFHASITLAKGGDVVQIDAPSSEAIALAFGRAVPVFVAETVLTQAGIDVDRFDFRKVREQQPMRADGARTDELEL